MEPQEQYSIKQVCRDIMELKLNLPATKRNRKRLQGLMHIWINFRLGQRKHWGYLYATKTTKLDFDSWFFETHLV